jgi:hypothetical protein
VYRFREKIDGCDVWYAVDCLGCIADIRIVRKGMKEATVVAELADLVYGKSKAPLLTLHRPRASSSPASAVLLRALQAPRRV